MVAELQQFTFVSGTTVGFISGTQTVARVLLCGMSGTQVIPLRVNAAGFLITASGA